MTSRQTALEGLFSLPPSFNSRRRPVTHPFEFVGGINPSPAGRLHGNRNVSLVVFFHVDALRHPASLPPPPPPPHQTTISISEALCAGVSSQPYSSVKGPIQLFFSFFFTLAAKREKKCFKKKRAANICVKLIGCSGAPTNRRRAGRGNNCGRIKHEGIVSMKTACGQRRRRRIGPAGEEGGERVDGNPPHTDCFLFSVHFSSRKWQTSHSGGD